MYTQRQLYNLKQNIFCICIRRIRQWSPMYKYTCILGWSLRLLYKTPSLGPYCWNFSMFRLRAFAASQCKKSSQTATGSMSNLRRCNRTVIACEQRPGMVEICILHHTAKWICIDQMQAAEADWIEIRRIKTCQTIEFFLASLEKQSRHKT